MAANRSVNRVFGQEPGRIVQVTVAQVSIAPLVVLLLLLSVSLIALFEVGLSFSEGVAQVTTSISTVVVIAFGMGSRVLPAVLTASIFAIVYRRLPNVDVEWRDSAFAAIVAIILFEIAKHLFFWFTNLSSQRHAVYGSMASAVILMTWGYIASLIFLYGASLARMAGELSPDTTKPVTPGSEGAGRRTSRHTRKEVNA